MCTVSRRLRLLHVSCVALLGGIAAGRGAAAANPTRTRHPGLPRTTSDAWFVPDATYRPAGSERDALTRLASGIDAYRGGKYEEALILLSRRGLPSSAANYASFYAGLSRLRLRQVEVARNELSRLRARQPIGYLSEATAVAEADAAVALGDHAGARQMYELLVKRTTATPDQIWLKLARTSLASEDRSRAAEAYRRIHDDFPLSAAAVEAESWLETAGVIPPLSPGNTRYRSALNKADALFDVRRYDEAQRLYERLQPYAQEPVKSHLAIRRAACDYFLRRHAAARRALRGYVTRDSGRADAKFFDLMSARALGHEEEFAQLAYAFVAQFPTNSETAEVLDTLATYHIRRNEDDRAVVAFRNVLSSFAAGPFGVRASWHVGWRAYRAGAYGRPQTN
jgi:tetratricopeptide (TPR) repeat protein